MSEDFRPGARLWLTRALVLRGLGAVYAVAFLVAALQNRVLIGAGGLTPARAFLERMGEAYGGRLAGFVARPSLFWLDASDATLLGAAWVGVALGLAAAAGRVRGPVFLGMWALYLSIVHVGQVWYGYGWETLLCEAGFLAIFLAPWRSGRLFDPRSPPAELVIWLYRWLAFRLMFGAGLIKLRGDACWTDLTCLQFHYETQPMPHPLSALWHRLPDGAHAAGVLVNHAVELVVPFFIFAPRPLRTAAGVALVGFQLSLIASGNLSFLNWLTLVIGLSCFEDEPMKRLLSHIDVSKMRQPPPHPARRWVLGALAVVVGLLSLAPVANMLSPGQVMNSSFDRLRLVNTYGAFGSVGRERLTVVVQGGPSAEGPWTDIPWRCQPVDVDARPCWLTPYHLRLDWQAWFAPFSDIYEHPWMVHLVARLLAGDPDVQGLMGESPFPDAPPPFVRLELYRYAFAPPGAAAWWTRDDLGTYLRPLSLDDPALRTFMEGYGWPMPSP
ncbi:MAG: lipase maturation factor family protein [Alphaproteobacteria bacterium]|nr:lipase maturation factor family protein [Alphaproteobacteria bacterium]